MLAIESCNKHKQREQKKHTETTFNLEGLQESIFDVLGNEKVNERKEAKEMLIKVSIVE